LPLCLGVRCASILSHPDPARKPFRAQVPYCAKHRAQGDGALKVVEHPLCGKILVARHALPKVRLVSTAWAAAPPNHLQRFANLSAVGAHRVRPQGYRMAYWGNRRRDKDCRAGGVEDRAMCFCPGEGGGAAGDTRRFHSPPLVPETAQNANVLMGCNWRAVCRQHRPFRDG
jgi:hypothetical protein